jgi:chromosome segregation ATPase
MAEEIVNTSQEVTTPPVNESNSTNDVSLQLKEANERAAKAELIAEQESKRAKELEKQFKNAKSKIGQYYDDRNQALEDQGAFKPLWEEANKTNQEMQKENASLKQQLDDLKNSYEISTTKQSALAEISKQGAIDSQQVLTLIESKIQRNAKGDVVVLDGGVEQDLSRYITSLKSPGSNFYHHFRANNTAGMGAKPSPVANTGGNVNNPYKTKNITEQLIMEKEDPNLAAVLKAEAS